MFSARHFALSGIFLLVVISAVTGCSDPYGLPDKVGFNKYIRPILADNCFQCHGPDEGTREGELRLDDEEDAKRPRDGYAIVVAGKPGKSELVRRIHLAEDDEDHMPHLDANKSLEPREIALLEKWIKQGARWEKHWAFVPPVQPTLPRSLRKAEPYQIIDYLIEAERTTRGLRAASPSDKHRLIRRLSYVLTGLPPDVAQVSSILADSQSTAVEAQIDQYLASPRYGERWARHWMDVVRYCESSGHEDDSPIGGAWHYRDYLIRAFNQDLSYDKLVIEHLAGDLLTAPRLHPVEGYNESVLGPSFLTLGEAKSFPLSLKQEETERIHAMIDVVSTGFQSLSVACARCHDHKFDPIPTTDYYAMYGMFESMRIGPRPAQFTPKRAMTLAEIQELKTTFRQQMASEPGSSQTDNLIKKTGLKGKRLNEFSTVEVDSSFAVIGDFRAGAWDGWYADGPAFGDGPVLGDILFDYKAKTLEQVGQGRASSRFYVPGVAGVLRSPNFIISHDSLLFRAKASRGTMRVIVENYQPINDLLYGALDDVWVDADWKNYAIDVSNWKGWQAYIEFMPGRYSLQSLKLKPEDFIEIEYAVAFSGARPDMGKTGRASQPLQIFSGRPYAEQISTFDSLTVAAHDTTYFPGITAGDPVQSPVFVRGDFEQLSDHVVSHGFLTAVDTDPVFTEDERAQANGSSRLAWANAVVNPGNPLTARIMVNRIWHHMFGRGIVESVDNFGAQGKTPSHPELLDYLALQFVKDGWSIKKMIKHIALTETFQQSVKVDSAYSSLDPQNIFLHHYPVRRLEAEAIRDGVLAVSGRLDATMYGKPVRMDYEPFKTARGNVPDSGPLDGAGRRSIYQEVRRNYFNAMMLIFDMPTPSSTVGQRNVSYTPAQSLSLLNDPFFHEQAHVWATHLIEHHSGLSLEKRINLLYKAAFARKATAIERTRGREFLEQQAIKYESALDKMLDEPKLWADYCHVLFNLKEFIHLL